MTTNVLPVSNKRRIKKDDDTQVILTNTQNPVLVELPVNEKIMDSIADNMDSILNIASTIVDIKKSRIETENQLMLMDKELERLKIMTDDYIKKEIEKRKNLVAKGELTIEILQNLTSSLSNNSDEVKMLLINKFAESIDKVWE